MDHRIIRLHLYLCCFLLFISSAGIALAQKSLLRSGPMLGYVEMQEANLWVQTTKPADIEIAYWPEGDPGTKSRVGTHSKAVNSNTAKFKLPDLEPGTTYKYGVYINGKRIKFSYPTRFTTQPLWQWRREPDSLAFAIGSCLYVNDKPYDRPGEPYGTSPEILESIAAKDPDLMIWMGDNVYYREPDFYSVPRMDYRYADARDTPELQPLLAGAVNLAIWDDHDYGPNNSDRTYRMREEALMIFKRYWLNPGYGIMDAPGAFTRYLYQDVEFFLMDDRFYRAPNDLKDESKAYFGEKQLRWLMDAVVNSEASFKIIVNGNQSTNRKLDHESFANYRMEFEKFMQFLKVQQIEGVLFLSGDLHYAQLLKTERPGLYPIYEYTSSPLTAGVFEVAESESSYDNPQHVEGTLVMDYNFGLIKVTGKRGSRILTIENYDRNGKRNWSRRISQKELRIEGGRPDR